MTPDQLARVERSVGMLKLMGHGALSSDIAALLRERGALRAALPTVEQLRDLARPVAPGIGPYCGACGSDHATEHHADCWIAKLLALLTGTTARTEGT